MCPKKRFNKNLNLSLAGLPPSSAASWLSSLDLHSEFSFAFSWFYTLLFTCDQSAFQISTSETLTSYGCTKLYVVDSRVYNFFTTWSSSKLKKYHHDRRHLDMCAIVFLLLLSSIEVGKVVESV